MKNIEYMNRAYGLSQEALLRNEIPIGAVIVLNGEIVGTGYNKREETLDISSHAEINAIRDAAQTLGRWNLSDCEIYITIEPCIMCYGAIEQSKIKKMYIGAKQLDFKQMSYRSRINKVNIEVNEEMLDDKYLESIKTFFKEKRKND